MPYLKAGKIIISSQVPAGFTSQIRKELKQIYPNKKFYFAYSPENLRLGKALKVFLEPNRIIIGTLPPEKNIFLPFFSIITARPEWMSIESAEMVKHAINAFLATSVSFANEIAVLCECVGANAKEVERGLKTEERIGPKAYLGPGAAFSGGTLARDVVFLSKLGRKNSLALYLIKSVKKSNDFHKGWVQRKCLENLGRLENKKITVLGLTYKPNTDTLRRSLSLELCLWLDKMKAKVKVFDPSIKELPPELKTVLSLELNIKDAVKNTDCIIVATEWPLFGN